jgi:F0F1-type ATP synthase assembly protein I
LPSNVKELRLESDGERRKTVRDDRLSMSRDAVESMQDNLDRGKSTIFAAYGLVGAILLLGAAGLLLDRALGTKPWCLLAGLVAGVCIGLYMVIRVLKRADNWPRAGVQERNVQ